MKKDDYNLFLIIGFGTTIGYVFINQFPDITILVRILYLLSMLVFTILWFVIIYTDNTKEFKYINDDTNFKLPYKTVKKMFNSLIDTKYLHFDENGFPIVEIKGKTYKIGFKSRLDYFHYISLFSKYERQQEKSAESKKREEEKRKLDLKNKQEFDSLKEFSKAIISEFSSSEFSSEKEEKALKVLTFDDSQDFFQEKGKEEKEKEDNLEEKVKNETLVFEPSINDSGNNFS